MGCCPTRANTCSKQAARAAHEEESHASEGKTHQTLQVPSEWQDDPREGSHQEGKDESAAETPKQGQVLPVTLQLKLILAAVALIAASSIGFLTYHAIELDSEIDRQRQTCEERVARCREGFVIRSGADAAAAESGATERNVAVELGQDTKKLLEALDRIGRP